VNGEPGKPIEKKGPAKKRSLGGRLARGYTSSPPSPKFPFLKKVMFQPNPLFTPTQTPEIPTGASKHKQRTRFKQVTKSYHPPGGVGKKKILKRELVGGRGGPPRLSLEKRWVQVRATILTKKRDKTSQIPRCHKGYSDTNEGGRIYIRAG